MSKRPAATASFQFPFEGRPKPLQRTGLFLLNAEVYLKLAGMSPQAAFAGEGLSALYRRLKRLQGRTVRPSIMLKIFTELFQRLNPPFRGDFDKALAGDAVALARIGRMGGFESALLGFGVQPEERKRRHWYLVVMERAGSRTIALSKPAGTGNV
ncbi:hypothetical protein [Cupriavidus oxalaticus]|uniref:Uncharacterized protein n=1 Tax=Cupriavidus oxalaticus TaxID=96344 RepID=A0A5P3VFM6_9BURK|nr:hypothetical protein [Cupriavidus oxalaticus]QEZ44162.1 hypothetical protein D2917_07905 [Cupriavidus oxalaticus]